MTGNINDRQPRNKPSSRPRTGQSSQRKIIADIEITLEKTPPRKFTGQSVGALADKVSKTLIWLRSSEADTQKFSGGKEAVRTYLRNAITKLNAAVIEYDKRGLSEKFIKDIEAGRKELFDALQHWE